MFASVIVYFTFFTAALAKVRTKFNGYMAPVVSPVLFLSFLESIFSFYWWICIANAIIIEEQIVLLVILHTRMGCVLLYPIIKFYLTYHLPIFGKHKSNSHMSKDR